MRTKTRTCIQIFLPSYQEAKDMPAGEDQPRMDSDNEHATGNWDFKPIYPYYGKEEAF